jgi:hypothetical protein
MSAVNFVAPMVLPFVSITINAGAVDVRRITRVAMDVLLLQAAAHVAIALYEIFDAKMYGNKNIEWAKMVRERLLPPILSAIFSYQVLKILREPTIGG